MSERTAKMSRAQRIALAWNDYPPDRKTPIRLKPIAKELVFLGFGDGIMYISDKWNRGEYKAYKHLFDADDPPVVLFDPKNNALIIKGGKFKITADGIVD